MMPLLAALSILLGAPVLKTDAIPLPDKDAQVFAVGLDADSRPEIAVLHEGVLTIYSLEEGGSAIRIILPANTTAFDVSDVNGDGRAEVVAIAGMEIVALEFDDAGEARTKALFEFDTIYNDPDMSPTPRVLVMPYDGHPVIALPGRKSFGLFTAQGKLIEQYPVKNLADDEDFSWGLPFYGGGSRLNGGGQDGGIKLHANKKFAYNADLPDSMRSARPGLHINYGWCCDHEDKPHSDAKFYGPYFIIAKNDEVSMLAFYSETGPGNHDTAIVIGTEQGPGGENEKAAMELGSPRRYSGHIIISERGCPPDFNGDGYADMALWTTPRPGRSVNAITRALSSRTWPLELRLHLFDPAKDRYTPKAHAAIETRLPMPDFFQSRRGGIAERCIFEDFNGDGMTDIAVFTCVNTLTLWLGGKKFDSRPDHEEKFPEQINNIVMIDNSSNPAGTMLILRGERNAYVMQSEE